MKSFLCSILFMFSFFLTAMADDCQNSLAQLITTQGANQLRITIPEAVIKKSNDLLTLLNRQSATQEQLDQFGIEIKQIFDEHQLNSKIKYYSNAIYPELQFPYLHIEQLNQHEYPSLNKMLRMSKAVKSNGISIDLFDRLGANTPAYFDPDGETVHLPIRYFQKHLMNKKISIIDWHELMHALLQSLRNRGHSTLYDVTWVAVGSDLPGDIGMYKKVFSSEELITFGSQPFWGFKEGMSKIDKIEISESVTKTRKMAQKLVNLARVSLDQLESNKSKILNQEIVEIKEGEVIIDLPRFNYIIGMSSQNTLDMNVLYENEIKRMKRIETFSMYIYENILNQLPAEMLDNNPRLFHQKSKQFADLLRHELKF